MGDVENIFFRKQSKTWCFWYVDENGKRRRKSTGKKLKKEAAVVREEFIHELRKKKTSKLLKDWAAPFFIRGECPREETRRGENKTTSVHHQKNQRAWLKKYILSDKISLKYLCEITRDDLIKFRSRLIEKLGYKMNTINKVMETLKVLFTEADNREVIDRNPFKGVGEFKYKRKPSSIFTIKELNKIFFENPPYPWRDLFDYTCFLIAATIGCRRGEILALQWKHVDFTHRIIHIHQAWKKHEGIGTTKTGIELNSPLPTVTYNALLNLKEKALDASPEAFVFSLDGKDCYKETWWKKRFDSAMSNVKIDRKTRKITPHSFRRTLNTLLRARMKDPELVRSFIGWTNEETQNIYTGFETEHLKQVAQAVDGLFVDKK